MATLMAFAGGKGGVGKSVVAANLAFQLARAGKRTILVDLDWGGSNAHTLLGVLNTNAGIGQYMLEKERTLAELVVPLEVPGLGFIPGDGLVAGAANLPFVRRQRLFRELVDLEADFVVLDLGAGTHSNTVDAFLLSGIGFLVTVPEPTAVLNAYSFLKTALYRLLIQSVPAMSEARGLLQEFFATRRDNEGAQGLDRLIETVRAQNPAQADKLAAARVRLKPRIVLNMAREKADLTLASKLRQTCARQLGLAVEFVGLMPWDEAVRKSVIHRVPLAKSHPEGAFGRAIGTLASRVVTAKFADQPPLEATNDLEELGGRL